MLEVKKGIFYQVSKFVEFFVISTLFGTIFLWWNDDLHALSRRSINDVVRIVGFIRQECIREKAINQADSFFAICLGTFSESDSNRHTMRIHGQMYLGIAPPFVRFIF